MNRFVALDVGNSAIHATLVEQRADGDTHLDPAPTTLLHEGLDASTLQFLDRLDEPLTWWAVSVNQAGLNRLKASLAERRPADCVRQLVHHDSPIPLRVDAPDKVGMDRVAAAVAANALRRRGAPALIVDSGTAITVDVVDQHGSFLGGAIMPGVRLAAIALNERTDGLPRIIPLDSPPPSIGANTEDAIRSGLYWGTFGGVKELIARHRASLTGEADLFLTGGAAVWSHLLQNARLTPGLTLMGVAEMAKARIASERDSHSNGSRQSPPLDCGEKP